MQANLNLNKTFKTILDLVFPPKCLTCGAVDDESDYPNLCRDCFESFVEIGEPYCTVCGTPFTSEHTESHACPACLTAKPFFDKTLSAGAYGGKLGEALTQYKYRNKMSLYKPFADFMIKVLGHSYSPSDLDLVVPVPHSRKRLRERGFDQVYLLAKNIAKHLDKPIDFKSLTKKTETRPQVGLALKEREKNLKGSFDAFDPEVFRGKRILLVDDVYTSGSTLNECSKVLKKEGKAIKVYGLTLARTLNLI